MPRLLVATLAMAIMASPTLAAKGDRKGDAKPRGPEQAATAISSVSGDRVRMAKAKVAQRVTRIGDAAADQVGPDGAPVEDAPAHADIAAVYLAPIRVPSKLLTQMDEDHPRGAADTFYGLDADWSSGDRGLFVAVELADGRPSDAIQQVEVGLDGDAAGPVQAGSAADTRAGVERFSLSGTFSDGSDSSGTTDVSGRRSGEAIDFYNANSGVFGFYEARQRTYYLVMPLTTDAGSVAVTLRTMTDEGEVLDRLDLPDGGHLVGLDDPSAGYEGQEDSGRLGCRSLETYSSAAGLGPIDDPDGTLVRYAAGADPSLSAAEAQALLAALDAYEQSVPVTLRSLDGDGEPLTVDARLSRAPALGAFTLTMEVPAGRWTFEAAGEAELRTPGGEALVDARSLTGQGGVVTGDGLDGFVSGDPTCARWNLGAASEACSLLPADGMATLVGRDAAEIEQREVARDDGSRWCVGVIPATGEPQYVARIGTDHVSSGRLEEQGISDADVGSAVEGEEAVEGGCPSHPLSVGLEGRTLDCGAAGYESHSFIVVPEATAAADPAGGLLVSIDMLVDGALPFGERYDAATATSSWGPGQRPRGLSTTCGRDCPARGRRDGRLGARGGPASDGSTEPQVRMR